MKSESLDLWVDHQFRYAVQAMLMSVSPLGILKTRPGFGQRIVPKKGAIIASPVLGNYDPEPDYFFHWFRDSAIVVDSLRLAFEARALGLEAITQLADFVQFSLELAALDGRRLLEEPAWRSRVAPDFVRFLRPVSELASVRGERVAADTRVNPDGTLDISRWGRPQNDGPSLRALALLRWTSLQPRLLGAELDVRLASLLRQDLAFARTHWQEPCYDIWEEEKGLHYYTLRVAACALEGGAAWLRESREEGEAQACAAEAAAIARLLDDYWLEDQQYYRSRMLEGGAHSSKDLDIAVILAAIHAPEVGGAHAARDPRMHATLARLEAMFDSAYAINHSRPPERGPALGRYAGDGYYSGGAFYFSTLAGAEFCFRAAAAASNPVPLIRRGDAYLETVRAFTAPGGDMSEQFDQRTGAQSSARHLAWSYAAFISCVMARRACRPRAGGAGSP
jgi:glucoamylase